MAIFGINIIFFSEIVRKSIRIYLFLGTYMEKIISGNKAERQNYVRNS